jgi:hypothetical protein
LATSLTRDEDCDLTPLRIIWAGIMVIGRREANAFREQRRRDRHNFASLQKSHLVGGDSRN